MEQGLDFPGGGRPARDAHPAAVSAGRFDWHGIAARLSAAHTLRHTLIDLSDAKTAKGSFDPAIARLIARWPHASCGFQPDALAGAGSEGAAMGASGASCFQPVNPVALADRKTTSGIPATAPTTEQPAIEG